MKVIHSKTILSRTLLLLTTAALTFGTTSCTSNEGDEPAAPDVVKGITVTADDFIAEGATRTSLDAATGRFSWSDGDTIGIFPSVGSQVAFPIDSRAQGTNTAAFDGGGWALRASATYAAYYPFSGSMYLDPEAVSVVYTGQKQRGDNNLTGLGTYDFMSSLPSKVDSSGNVNFHFSHHNALLRLRLTLPESASLQQLQLRSASPVFTATGALDINTGALTPVRKTATLCLDLEDVSTTAASRNTVTLYMYVAPVAAADLAAHQGSAVDSSASSAVSVLLFSQDGRAWKASLPVKELRAGYAYSRAVTLQPSDDVINTSGVIMPEL